MSLQKTFSVRLSHILCKFHITNLPSKSDLLNIVFNSQVPLIQQNQDVCQKDVSTNHLPTLIENSSSIIDSNTSISSTQTQGDKIEVEEVPTPFDHYSLLKGENHTSFTQNLEPILNGEELIYDEFICTNKEVDYFDERQYSDSFVTKKDQDELIINQTICSSFSDFCTNFSSDSNINEHKYINNNFMCSYNLIEHVGETDMNLSESTKCCS